MEGRLSLIIWVFEILDVDEKKKALSCDRTNRIQTTAIKPVSKHRWVDEKNGGGEKLVSSPEDQHGPEGWRRLVDW